MLRGYVVSMEMPPGPDRLLPPSVPPDSPAPSAGAFSGSPPVYVASDIARNLWRVECLVRTSRSCVWVQAWLV